MGNAIDEAYGKDGCRFHVDANGSDLPQIVFECFIVFPNPAVGRIDGSGKIVGAKFADGMADGHLESETGQGGDFRFHIVIASPFSPDRRYGQNQIAQGGDLFQATAFPQEKHGFGRDCRKQVHDGGGHGAAHSEIDDRDVICGSGLHRKSISFDFYIILLRKHLHIIDEVGEEDIAAKIFEGSTSITGQPVGDNFGFRFHAANIEYHRGQGAMERGGGEIFTKCSFLKPKASKGVNLAESKTQRNMATITLGGNETHTAGELPAVGSAAPDFTVTGTDLQDITLSQFKGQNVVLNIFPSIDTGVCAMSTRRFNEALENTENTVVLCISRDLPFAHKRFCEAEGLKSVIPASDFRNTSFGENYPVAVNDGPFSGLFSRAVVVVNPDGNVAYTEQVPEIGQEPNYDAAMAAIQ